MRGLAGVGATSDGALIVSPIHNRSGLRLLTRSPQDRGADKRLIATVPDATDSAPHKVVR